jgi:hexosaminidase
VLQLTGPSSAKPQSIAVEATAQLGSRDESYSLTVPADGSTAVLKANSTLGLFRGLTTFSQLWYTSGDSIYTLQAPIQIDDSPAFPYRGFMLDTARNYFPVSDIKRTLDAMSWVKINTLHWHIVDSQSFPLVVDKFPELSQKAAYSPTSVYTVKDIQDIVKYAGERGIDIMMEIDTPGHTSAISKSHPEFIACPEASPWTQFANEPPAGQLRLADPKVLKFTQDLFTSVLKYLPSKYFSTGGDELNPNCYEKDPPTQASLKASGQTLAQALAGFVNGTHAAVRGTGKIPVVWEEMVLDHALSLPNDTVVMVWQSSYNVQSVVQKGYQVIHAPSDFFYLDCGGGGWVGKNVGGNSWCDPFKTWQKSYSFNPLANVPADQAHLILGGQHLLWTEQSGPQNLDPVVWPRAASSAEVFWTGATMPNGQPRDVGEALARLHDLRYRMVNRGVNAINLQPHWCALRPGACDL